jgi:DNA-binding IclR family transcriptional regulator
VNTCWVLCEEQAKYRVSLQPFHHFSKPLRRSSIRQAAAGPLRQLWQETGENCYLGVLDGDRVLFVEAFEATGEVRIVAQPGGRHALHCCAQGKVLLAHAPTELFERLARSGFHANTDGSVCDPALLREELDAVVRQGYALDREEYTRGVLCFAAPIFNHEDRVIGTVGISVITLYFTADELLRRLGPQVLKTAQEISLKLGMNEDRADRYRIAEN